MQSKPTVVVVFHHIGPYHHARLNAAADRLSVTGFEWSAKAYDAWGTADAPVRYHKISLFPEAADRHPRAGFGTGKGLVVNEAIASGLPVIVGSELQNCGRLWTGSVWRRVGGCNCNGHQRHAKETWNNR